MTSSINPPDFTSLSLERKIGQLLFIGLQGTELDAQNSALIKDIQPGGIIIFGRNVASARQLRELLDGARQISEQPPLLGIDQEGGLVDRLRKICTPMPAARVIRQHGDLAGARTLGRITGELLLQLGLNVNFAPVMSIMNETRDLLQNGLYSRSFGRSPGEVFGYTSVYLRGLQATGCLGCVKHFPGIGAGEIDSHEEMPVIRLTHDDLIALDLAPYIEMFREEPPYVHIVMVGHGGFPHFNVTREASGRVITTSGKIIPASINYDIVTKLLRDELRFKGLVVTDDMEMGAVAKNYPIEEAVVLALQAGQDMQLICANPDMIRRAHVALIRAVETGQITDSQVNAALERIASTKKLIKPFPDFEEREIVKLSGEINQLNLKLGYIYGDKF